ncbi:MAG: hypothetical protein OZ948_09770 [Deltaproteobacteria bacterium]|nr:hypothetical protein [Deltaproteobacteria bacterium]
MRERHAWLVGTVGLWAVLAVATARPSAGAPEARPAAAEIIRLTVREGHETQIEEFLARLAEAARRTKAPVRWRVHRRVDGERPLYVLVLQAPSAEQLEAWSSLDASSTLQAAYGGDEAQRLLALREAALEGMQRERFLAQPALGFDD